MKKKSSFNLNHFFQDLRLKKQYVNILKNKILLLDEIKKKNYKYLNPSLRSTDSFLASNDLRILYIISVQFLKSNTLFYVTDFKGNLLFFYSAGFFNYKGKRKRNRLATLKNVFYVLVTKLKFLEKKPLALHLKNVNSNRFWLIKQLKTKFFIKTVQNFIFYPHNGCRKSKVRRKKYKKTKKKWLSGLRRQIVNLLRFLIVGSNPTFFIIIIWLICNI